MWAVVRLKGLPIDSWLGDAICGENTYDVTKLSDTVFSMY